MSPSEASIGNPISLTGTLTWIYDVGGADKTPVDKALIRGEHDIVVECNWKGTVYTIPLHSQDGIQFAADFPYSADGKTYRVQASAKLWSNKAGWLLFGRWIEGGDEMYWTTELQET